MMRSNSAADLIALPWIAREEHEARAVASGQREIDAERRGHPPQEPIRHLNQNAGAVTRIGLAAAGAAMQQIDEDLEAARNHAVRGAPRDVDHEPDAACVVFVGRIVESARLRGFCR